MVSRPIHGISNLSCKISFVEPAFVLVLQHELRRSLCERASGPDAIDLRAPPRSRTLAPPRYWSAHSAVMIFEEPSLVTSCST